MASSLRSKAFFTAALLALGIGLNEADAQTRVRGTITAVDGNSFVVDGKTKVALGDIKPGDFLGVTSVKHADGKLIAYEVRRFPKPVSPGHRPFDGRDDQTMTNATVDATVQSTNGRELTMTYEGGTQKITVPPDAAVSTLVPGTRAQLVPGAPVNLT